MAGHLVPLTSLAIPNGRLEGLSLRIDGVEHRLQFNTSLIMLGYDDSLVIILQNGLMMVNLGRQTAPLDPEAMKDQHDLEKRMREAASRVDEP